MDKGYHSGQTLVDLEAVDVRTYIAEPDRGRRHWCTSRAEDVAFKRNEQRVVYNNRRRIRGARSKGMHRKRRGELVERTFEHALDDGGMRRAHLKGRENISKRYLIHIAAFNLGLIMRTILRRGIPKGWADAAREGLRGLLRRCIVRTRLVTALVRQVARRVWNAAKPSVNPQTARFAA